MIWQPYSQDILQQLPPYCFAGQNIWQTKSPLICFHIVEFHYPQRVARQFGFRQYIPEDCDTNARLHRIDLRGYLSHDWHLTHRGFIDDWDNRSENLFFEEPSADEVQYYDPYMVWYRNITRRFISRSEAMYEHMVRNFIIFSFCILFVIHLFCYSLVSLFQLFVYSRLIA